MKPATNDKVGSPTFAFRLEPDDAVTFNEFVKANRMNVSSAVRFCLVKAGALPIKREAKDVQLLQA